MKTLRLFFIALGVMLVSSLSFTSCLDDDGYSLGDLWFSLATVTPHGDNSFILTLDDGTTLFRATSDYYTKYYPTKRQRAQVYYTILGDDYNGFDHAITLSRLDTVLTKPVAANLGSVENDKVYGTDPVAIEDKDVWIGDDFLNVIFRFNYTPDSKKHYINLVPVEGNDPYLFEFRHNAYGDTSGEGGTGIVAFDLQNLETEGNEVTLKIKIKTFSGEKTIEKKYNKGMATTDSTEKSLKSNEDDDENMFE